MNIAIAPSILAADFSKLGKEVEALEQAKADYIHIDVMDGHFVPNITIGPGVIRSIRNFTKLPFDVHLMIQPVEQHLEAFAQAGADIITVHIEAVTHLHRVVERIRSLGRKVGISLVPSTAPEAISWILPEVDLVLVMSVNPGFGGQEFIPSTLQKIAAIRHMIDDTGKDILLEVDGGITAQNAKDVIDAGANIIVAGTAVFKGNYKKNIEALRGIKE